MISAGAVACGGTIPISGARKRNGKNSAPVTTLVQPVRPPAATPAPDSMYVVADDEDAAPPAIAESESTSSGRFTLSISPSLFRYPAGFPTPTSVPIVSKKSDRKSANTQTSAETTPSVANAPKLNSPSSEKFGSETISLGHTAPAVKPAP